MKNKLRVILKSRQEVCPCGDSYKVRMMRCCLECEIYEEIFPNCGTFKGCDCDEKPQKLLIKSCDNCKSYQRDSLECPSCQRKLRKCNIGLHKFSYYCPQCSGYNALVAKSQIPEEFFRNPLSDLKLNDFNRALVRFIHQVGENVGLLDWAVLVGPPSSGKTEFACQLLRILMRKWLIPVRYIHLPTYLQAFQRSPFPDATTDEKQLRLAHGQEVLNAKVLLMDDINSDKPNPSFKRDLYNLICYRHSHRLSTILTSQFTHNKLVSIFDEQTIARIRQRAKWFIPGIEDMRRQPEA